MKPFLFTIAASILFHPIVSADDTRAMAAGDVGKKVEIIGDLGVPVGKKVTITGRKERNGPLANWFWVATVDGKKKEIGIQIDGISHWPDGTEATLSGAEVGTLKFLTLKMTNYGPNDSRWKGPHQKLFLRFQVNKIVAPANLVLKK